MPKNRDYRHASEVEEILQEFLGASIDVRLEIGRMVSARDNPEAMALSYRELLRFLENAVNGAVHAMVQIRRLKNTDNEQNQN